MNFWTSLKSLPWARIGLSVLCCVLAVVLIAGIAVTAFIENTLNQIGRPGDGPNLEYDYTDPTLPTAATVPTESVDPTAPTDPSASTAPTLPSETEPPAPTVNIPSIEHKDIVNIMLVGMDRRPDESYRTRSDAMILCTVNKRSNTITMTSFLRDLYVQIPGHGGNKLNAAYQIGGMKKLSETLKVNFGITVDQFITVDFASFPKVIDILGGVDIYLRQEEADYLKTAYGFSLTAGTNRLTGAEALGYSRIRRIGSDFERTLRQRKVITSIMESCKTLNGKQALALVYEFLPLVQTNMDNGTIVNYAVDFLPILVNGNLVSQRIPLDGTWKDATIGKVGDALVIRDLEANLEFLWQTLMPQ